VTDIDIAVAAAGEPKAPELPPGRDVTLPDLGTVFVRDLPGPPGAPTVVLLHGWTASADLNFFTCYGPLAERYRVIAFDHRGHGRGLRAKRAFRLDDCADDVIAVLDELGVDTVIPFGYSMGGTVAQLLWYRHRERVDGLVLGATAPYFAGRQAERLSFIGLTGLAALARVTPAQARSWLTDQFYLQRKDWGEWAIEQASQHDWRMILEAGKAIGEFSSSEWIVSVDVPTSVIITMRDNVVPLRRQVKLFEWIPDAEPYRVDAAHDAIVSSAGRFVPQLLRALASVTARIDARSSEPARR
jgi:3-oxoadipate enol-lactonase